MTVWHGGKILRDSLGGYAVAADRQHAARPGYEEVDTWLSPSQVAEYVYCPEAHRLRDQVSAEPTARQQEGQVAHEQLLRRYKASRSLTPVRILFWVLAALGAAAAALALAGRL